METTITLESKKILKTAFRSRRFATLDFARGAAIFIMIALHTIAYSLNIGEMFANLDNLALINLVALALIPFYGACAGFFLLVSATSNMVSMMKDLERGISVRGLVYKQVFGGILLLAFAMLCEALIGYNGAFGNFFKFFLDNPADYFNYNPLANYEDWFKGVAFNWQVLLYRWNHFETIHTIAWCLIINGSIQGLLSLKGRWQNRKHLIITYALLAVLVMLLTQPIWELVGLILPGYPFGFIAETGNVSFTPVIGQDSWWRIITAPFLGALAAPMEPLFPYLAISFLGSILGVLFTKPKEEITKRIPRTFFLIGTGMFVIGLAGIIGVIVTVLNKTDFDTAISLYQFLPYHRHWSPDFASYIPLFSWVPQFLAVNGFSLMILMFLFRLIEFRGKSKVFSDKTRIVRRFGSVAFSNYNNQWLFYIVFFLTSLLITRMPYQRLYWPGTLLTIILSLSLFAVLNWGWEKIGYILSLEWTIRLITNNVIPARRARFDSDVRWWQRAKMNIQGTFYEPEWIDFVNPEQGKKTSEETNNETIEKENQKEETEVTPEDSKLALILSIVGLTTLLFNAASIFGLFVALNARKVEGKNKQNTIALVLSIIGCVLFVAFYVVCFSIKIGTLGIPL